MSTVSYALRKPQPNPRPNPVATPPRERLHVVPAITKRRVTWPMWILVTALLILSLVVPVVINAQMAMTSYAMYAQRQELSQLQDYQADLVTRAREAQSPQKLAQKARELGLVPAGSPGYISLAEHSVTPGQAAR